MSRAASQLISVGGWRSNRGGGRIAKVEGGKTVMLKFRKKEGAKGKIHI